MKPLSIVRYIAKLPEESVHALASGTDKEKQSVRLALCHMILADYLEAVELGKYESTQEFFRACAYCTLLWDYTAHQCNLAKELHQCIVDASVISDGADAYRLQAQIMLYRQLLDAEKEARDIILKENEKNNQRRTSIRPKIWSK